MSKHISYSNEANKTLNAKIYYKSEPEILSLDLTQYYLIKSTFIDPDRKSGLIDVFTSTLEPIELGNIVINYLENNYFQPDGLIYRNVLLLILEVMPYIDESTYVQNIKDFICLEQKD